MAASSLVVTVTLVVVVMLGIFDAPILMGRGDDQMVSPTPSQCKEEKNLLVNACKAVILGSSPSPECCQRVRLSHVDCVCPLVTPQVAALIGVERTIKQIEACGRTVPHNFKCGSITTP
ncbi:hypothetical protein CCACVL1_05815 [Corchorus capsularis]|uniref:Bifunctional inhibitor/plant lipid transfer protein/seed storage helical domain-containing protein n=1 Tax=Corchorus capsularis TaxID=210143 RepID=A0A1R3JJ37_COCAP|nr:hypothetical protein CCACVL1_05815 [Corchorus capsularis]